MFGCRSSIGCVNPVSVIGLNTSPFCGTFNAICLFVFFLNSFVKLLRCSLMFLYFFSYIFVPPIFRFSNDFVDVFCGFYVFIFSTFWILLWSLTYIWNSILDILNVIFLCIINNYKTEKMRLFLNKSRIIGCEKKWEAKRKSILRRKGEKENSKKKKKTLKKHSVFSQN